MRTFTSEDARRLTRTTTLTGLGRPALPRDWVLDDRDHAPSDHGAADPVLRVTTAPLARTDDSGR